MGEIIIWVSRYLMVGVIVTWGLDMINKSAFNLHGNENQRFQNSERVWIIILWPLMVLVFIYHFFKATK